MALQIKESYFKIKKIGFSNIGNSCYMNSFLQILLHCPNFVKELQNLYQHCSFENNLIKNIIDLSKSEYPYNKKYLYEIKNCMKNIEDYGLFIQNDSQDFGKDLINEIIEQYKKINKYINFDSIKQQNLLLLKVEKKNITNKIYNNSFSQLKNKIIFFNKFIDNFQKREISIEKMFTINEIETIAKDKMNYDYIINTSFDIELTFPNQNNENKLMDLFDYKYCLDNSDSKFNKKFLNIIERKICKLPHILIITILRRLLGKNYILSKLLIPEKIDLNKYIDKDIIKDNKFKYDLFAINKKIGKTHMRGHYICDIKVKDKWFEFDDEYVREITFNPNIPSFSAIGLFYIKTYK